MEDFNLNLHVKEYRIKNVLYFGKTRRAKKEVDDKIK